MKAKIIPLSKTQKNSLSSLMIATLVEASIKQKQGIPFGPADIKGGSVVSLINRGLIIRKEVKIENQSQQMWLAYT